MRNSHDQVRLQVPAQRDFVLVARLVLTALANRAGFSYAVIEDLRLALSELCVLVIDIAQEQSVLDLSMTSTVEPDRCRLTVRGVVPASASADGPVLDPFARSVLENVIDSYELISVEGRWIFEMVKSTSRT